MLYKKLRWIIASMSLIVTTLGASQNMYIKTHMGLYGNTGFRGSILPDQEDSLVVANDFYIIQFKVLINCTVVVDAMEVKKADKTYMLKPTFLDCKIEMKVTAGETISVRAEKNEQAEEIVRELRTLGYQVYSLLEQTKRGRMATVRLTKGMGGSILVDLLFASSGIELTDRTKHVCGELQNLFCI